MPVRRLHLALLWAALLVGCGKEPTPPPDVATPAPPDGTNPQRFAAAGVAFDAPGGWDVRPGKAPLVATITSGQASVALFRYPRTEPLPRTREELDEAAAALVGAARQRDPEFDERGRDRARVDGRPAVVVRGGEIVAGQPRRVRSTHVYAFAGEVVVDAFAAADDFARVDDEAFRALLRSVRLTAPTS